MRICIKCAAEVPDNRMSQAKTYPDWCCACLTKKFKTYYGQHKDKIKSQARKRYRDDPKHKAAVRARLLLKRFGLTPEQWQERFDKQGRCCALCKKPDSGKKYWAVDHDHRCCPSDVSCGKCIRGILCNICNLGIGYLKDSPDLLRSAASYIENGGVCVNA